MRTVSSRGGWEGGGWRSHRRREGWLIEAREPEPQRRRGVSLQPLTVLQGPDGPEPRHHDTVPRTAQCGPWGISGGTFSRIRSRWPPSGLPNTPAVVSGGGGGRGGAVSPLSSLCRGDGDRGCPSHKGHRRDLLHGGPTGQVGKRRIPRAGGALPKGTLSTWPFSPPPHPRQGQAGLEGARVNLGASSCSSGHLEPRWAEGAHPASQESISPPPTPGPLHHRTGSHLARRLPEEASKVVDNLPA